MMQATIGTLSRMFSRSLVSGVVDRVDTISSKVNNNPEHQLTTAVSGFPKSKNGQFNIENILKGQIGDDAYFIARHVDDWNNNDQVKEPPEKILNPGSDYERKNKQLDLPNRSFKNNSADVLGVADGVGGWRAYGVDPGLFSLNLMKSCERLVKSGYFVSDQPAQLLASGFREMQESKRPVIGSSTACVAILNHADGKLYSANIGDSGFLVFRGGRVVHRYKIISAFEFFDFFFYILNSFSILSI